MAIAPKYQYEIRIYNAAGAVIATRMMRPIWSDKVTREYAKQSGEQFFRASLNGELSFVGPDYDWLMSQDIATTFHLYISISYDFGTTWSTYQVVTFTRLDANINADDMAYRVNTFTTLDAYNDILNGIDHEYNLIDLKPALSEILIDKRPLVQVYTLGDSVVGCVMNSMYWEISCTPVTTENELLNTYHFGLIKSEIIIDLTGGVTASAVGASGSGDWQINVYWEDSDPNEAHWECFVHRISDGAEWLGVDDTAPQSQPPTQFDLEPQNATASEIGSLVYTRSERKIYGRFLCDKLDWTGVAQVFPIPYNDMAESNRNYHYCTGYYNATSVQFSANLSETPSKYGLYQPGIYYLPPNSYDVFLPIARSTWTGVSIWFSVADWDWNIERAGRTEWKMKDGVPIWAAIKVLLAKIAPGITHEGTAAYSQFLYGENPILGTNWRLFITQKTNIIYSGYDQPASRAPITLRQILDMLRDAFKCYWFIDDNGRLRIEHIQFFRNGGSYTGTPVIGTNLRSLYEKRNGKSLAFGTSKWSYNKSDLSGRIEFGWMDEVTQPFVGEPINITSLYVDKERTEKVSVANFTSDIDYMLMAPNMISKDGFALMAAIGEPDTSYNYRQLGYLTSAQISSIGSIISGYPDFAVTNKIPIGPGGLRIASTNQFFGLGYINYYDNLGALLTTKSWQEVATRVSDDLADGFNLAYVDGAREVRITVRGVGTGTLSSLTIYVMSEKLPYLPWNGGYLQNGQLAFIELYKCYLYDLSGWDAEWNGNAITAQGVKRSKQQSLSFPILQDIDPINLIRTNIGDGAIEKISINFVSRECTVDLCYDIEQQ